MRELSVLLTPWAVTNAAISVDVHTALAIAGVLLVRAGYRWWQSPWCAVCYRGWAWRTRMVHKRWSVPVAMHVCGRCARDIDDKRAYGR